MKVALVQIFLPTIEGKSINIIHAGRRIGFIIVLERAKPQMKSLLFPLPVGPDQLYFSTFSSE